MAGTAEGPVAGPFPLILALALYLDDDVEVDAEGGAGTFAEGGGTCDDGTKKASGWDCV